MQRKTAKFSSLFLLELIIAILFFCLASAVCVRFFVKSHLIEQETTNLNHATDYAVSVAEILRSNTDIDTCLKEQFSYGDSEQPGEYIIYFNQEWNICNEADASYLLYLQYDKNEEYLTGQIDVSTADKKKLIYSTEIKKYLQKEVQRS